MGNTKYSGFCDLGTKIKSVMLDVNKFTEAQAKHWLKENDFKYGSMTVTDNYRHFSQEESSDFKEDSFRTTDFGKLPDGIKAVIGCPKHAKFESGGDVATFYIPQIGAEGECATEKFAAGGSVADDWIRKNSSVKGIYYLSETISSNKYLKIMHEKSGKSIYNFTSAPVEKITSIIKLSDEILGKVNWDISEAELTEEHGKILKEFLKHIALNHHGKYAIKDSASMETGGAVATAPNYKFELVDYDADIYEDDFESGEGERVNGVEHKVNLTFDKTEDLFNYICTKILFKEMERSDFVAFEDGRITISVTVDVNNYPASEAEIEKWKKGKMQLFSANYNFYVKLVDRETPSVEELSEIFGISKYECGGQIMEKGGDVNENSGSVFLGFDGNKLKWIAYGEAEQNTMPLVGSVMEITVNRVAYDHRKVNEHNYEQYIKDNERFEKGGAVAAGRTKVLFEEKNLRIEEKNGVLKFDFGSRNAGWSHDTTDIGEAAAIIMGSEFKDNKGVLTIPLTKKQKDAISAFDVIYWLSGGGKEWKGGEFYNEPYEVVYERCFKREFEEKLKDAIAHAKSIGDLIKIYKKDFPAMKFAEAAMEDGLAGEQEEEFAKGGDVKKNKEHYHKKIAKKIKANPALAGKEYQMSVKEAEKVLGEKIVTEYPSFGNEFKELVDRGDVQTYARDCGSELLGSKRIPLVAIGNISEGSDGKHFVATVELFANPAFIAKEHWNGVRESTGLEDSEDMDLYIDLVGGYMEGVPVADKQFKTKMEALNYLLGQPLKEELDRIGKTITTSHLDAPIGHSGKNGWDVIKHQIDAGHDLFAKGGAVNEVEELKKKYAESDIAQVKKTGYVEVPNTTHGTLSIREHQATYSITNSKDVSLYEGNEDGALKLIMDSLMPEIMFRPDFEIHKKGDLVFCKNEGSSGLVGLVISGIKKSDDQYEMMGYDVYFRGLRGEILHVDTADMEDIMPKHMYYAEQKGDLMHYPNIARDRGITLNPKYLAAENTERDWQTEQFAKGGNVKKSGVVFTAANIDVVAKFNAIDFHYEFQSISTDSFLFKVPTGKTAIQLLQELKNGVSQYSDIKGKWTIVDEFEKGGSITEANQIVIASLSKLIEYSEKIPPLVKKAAELPAWIVSKMAKVEQSIANVKHRLQPMHPHLFEKGGSLDMTGDGDYISMQCKHIGKYSEMLKDAVDKGVKLEAWMEYQINLSGDYIDSVYHFLDYKINGVKFEKGGGLATFLNGVGEDLMEQMALGGSIGIEALLKKKQFSSLFLGETWGELVDKVITYFLPNFTKPLVLQNGGISLSDNFTRHYGGKDNNRPEVKSSIADFIADYEKYPNATVKISADGINSFTFPRTVAKYLVDKLKKSIDYKPEVDGFKLIYSRWSKMMGGNGISGRIGTSPQGYYVATINDDGKISFDTWKGTNDPIEVMTKDIDKEKVRKLWDAGEIHEGFRSPAEEMESDWNKVAYKDIAHKYESGGSINEDLVEFDVPEWSLSFLVNGDGSGLSDEDNEKLLAWVSNVVEQYGNANFSPAGEDDYELGFRHRNDIDNLGSNCFRLVLLPSKKREVVEPIGKYSISVGEGWKLSEKYDEYFKLEDGVLLAAANHGNGTMEKDFVSVEPVEEENEQEFTDEMVKLFGEAAYSAEPINEFENIKKMAAGGEVGKKKFTSQTFHTLPIGAKFQDRPDTQHCVFEKTEKSKAKCIGQEGFGNTRQIGNIKPFAPFAAVYIEKFENGGAVSGRKVEVFLPKVQNKISDHFNENEKPKYHKDEKVWISYNGQARSGNIDSIKTVADKEWGYKHIYAIYKFDGDHHVDASGFYEDEVYPSLEEMREKVRHYTVTEDADEFALGGEIAPKMNFKKGDVWENEFYEKYPNDIFSSTPSRNSEEFSLLLKVEKELSQFDGCKVELKYIREGSFGGQSVQTEIGNIRSEYLQTYFPNFNSKATMFFKGKVTTKYIPLNAYAQNVPIEIKVLSCGNIDRSYEPDRFDRACEEINKVMDKAKRFEYTGNGQYDMFKDLEQNSYNINRVMNGNNEKDIEVVRGLLEEFSRLRDKYHFIEAAHSGRYLAKIKAGEMTAERVIEILNNNGVPVPHDILALKQTA